MSSLSSLLLSSAQAADGGKGFWDVISPPEDISTTGHLIDSLFNYVTFMNIFFFFFVCVGIFGFSFLYSKRRHPRAFYDKGNSKKQMILLTVIASSVFFALDMYITSRSNNDLHNVFWNWPDSKKEEVFRVQVLAQQWAWHFRLPGKDNKFNTLDDIVTTNDLRLPIGKKVVFQITSKDVLHSFYLPNTRQKVDAIPGRVTRMWVEFTKDGVFDIACAEMCGTHHYLMKAQLTVYTPEDFNKWKQEAQIYALSAVDIENPDSFWGWTWEVQ